MRYHLLGQTGLFVSEMCLGTMVFGRSKNPLYAGAGGVTQDEVNAIVPKAFDAGINFVDTANVYSEGQSEEMIGLSLKANSISRTDVVIATKFEHAVGSGPNDSGASRHHIMSQVQGSLKRLGTDYIDLYQLHGFDPATPIDETLRALEDLVRNGLVRYVGVSNWLAWQVAKAHGIAAQLNVSKLQSYQGYYSLVGRGVEREITPMLEAENVSMIVFSPLAGGYLTGKYRSGSDGRRAKVPFPPVDETQGEKILEVVGTIAKKLETTFEAVSLAWLLQKKSVASVILGVKNVEQLSQNLTAGTLKLSIEDMHALDQVSALPIEYPGWMIENSEAPRRNLMKTNKTQNHL